jgi:hypothetical protein
MDDGMVNWLTWLMEFVAARPDPCDQLLAIFDGLQELFTQPWFAGSALGNAVARRGTGSPIVSDESRAQRAELRDYVVNLAQRAGIADPSELAEAWTLLVDGALVAAQRLQAPSPARLARSAAEQLLSAHLRSTP